MANDYDSEEKIIALVKNFENASIRRDEWGHQEHLVVALYFVSILDQASATERMRNGIRKLLSDGFGIALESDSPYHETLTIFWMGAVRHFFDSRSSMPLSTLAAVIPGQLEKDLPLSYYDSDQIFSDEAKKQFIRPRNPFPWEKGSACPNHS